MSRIPRSEMRRQLIALVTGGICLFLIIGLGESTSFFLLHPALFFLPIVGWFAYFPALALMKRRFRRRLIAADYMICPSCDYRLDGLGDQGACPECGKEFRSADVRALWRRHYPSRLDSEHR